MEMKKPPFRAWVAVMVFFASFVNFTIEYYFLLTLNCETDLDHYLLENGYLVGYIIGALASGPLTDFYGPYWTVLVGTTFDIVITTCYKLVMMKEADKSLVKTVIRILGGMVGSLHYPALQVLIASWAPPNEKGKFGACIVGGSRLSFLVMQFLYMNTDSRSWVFYVTCITTLVFLFAWSFIISDAPAKSGQCSAEEVQHITQSQGGSVTAGKSSPPLKAMLTSTPYLALIASHFVTVWGFHIIIRKIPALTLYDPKNLSLVPGLLSLLFVFVSGSIADYILRKEISTKVYMRKRFTVLSHLLPGVVLLVFMVIGDETFVILSLLVLAVVFNSAIVATTLMNVQDLAPNYAGTQYGLILFFGYLTYTSFAQDLEGNEMYGITGGVYIVSGLIFMLFGSVDLQPWNAKVTA